jgi:monoamine oxidase
MVEILNEENYVDIITLNDGNQVLPEKLAKFLGEKVHLNMPLSAISKTLEGSYDLMFRDGQQVKADILVLAIPCSVYGDIAFEENVIPKEQLELIKSIKYGTNAKILIPFSKLPSQKMTFIDDRIVCFFADA